jgi:hypothetical protein
MARTMTKLMTVALLVAGLVGCKDDPNPCDSTSYLSGSDCLPYTDAALLPDLPPVTDVATPAVDSEISEAGSASKMGAPCTDTVTHAECQGPDTDYCAKEPNKPAYCTKSACVTDADCPTGWTCFDLAKQVGIKGYPTMCTMPAS